MDFLTSNGGIAWTGGVKELLDSTNRKQRTEDAYQVHLEDFEPTSVLDVSSRFSPPLNCTCLENKNCNSDLLLESHPDPSCPHGHLCWGSCQHPAMPHTQFLSHPAMHHTHVLSHQAAVRAESTHFWTESEEPYIFPSDPAMNNFNWVDETHELQMNDAVYEFMYSDNRPFLVSCADNDLAYVQYGLHDASTAGLYTSAPLPTHVADERTDSSPLGALSMETDDSDFRASSSDITDSSLPFRCSLDEENLVDSFINNTETAEACDDSIPSAMDACPIGCFSLSSFGSEASPNEEDVETIQFPTSLSSRIDSCAARPRQRKGSFSRGSQAAAKATARTFSSGEYDRYHGTTHVPQSDSFAPCMTGQVSPNADRCHLRNVQDSLAIDWNVLPQAQTSPRTYDSAQPARRDKSDGSADDHGLRLVHILLACAEAVAWRDIALAAALLDRLRTLASYTGDSIERVTCCFTEGLFARLAGMSKGSIRPTYQMPPPSQRTEGLLQLSQCSPYISFGIFAANEAILQAFERKKKVHIIDLGMLQKLQWPNLIRALSSRQEGPPDLRITAIGATLGELNDWGRELGQFAASMNVPFEFHAAAEGLEPAILTQNVLKLREGETLAINSVLQLHRVVKESRGSLKNVLQALHRLGPAVVTVVEQDASHNGPFFLGRFLEALHYYSAIFDSFEASLPRNSQQRLKVERFYFAEEIRNIVACEGYERVERHEKADQWRRQMSRAGFQSTPLKFMSQARMMLSLYCCDGYTLAEEKGSLILGWKGTPIMLASAWKCANQASSATSAPPKT